MSIQPNYPLFDPAFNASVTGESYENPTNTVYTPPVLGTGNPDPVYDPAFAEYVEGTPYEDAPNGPAIVPYYSPDYNQKKTGNAYQTQGTVYNQPPAQPSAQPTGVYGPAFFSANLHQSYQAAGQQYNTVTGQSTGDPDPVYGPAFAAAATQQSYQPDGQVNDSQVVSPVITFQVNLLNPLLPGGDLPPNRTSLDGNEIVSEANNQLATRTVWFPDMVVNSDGSTGGSPAVEGIGGIFAGQNGNGQNGASYNHPQGYLHHGSLFTVKGQRAMYLKNLFVSNPPAPADLLIVVSQS
jgi:hypothetical protein